jgi:hypothetical protein
MRNQIVGQDLTDLRDWQLDRLLTHTQELTAGRQGASAQGDIDAYHLKSLKGLIMAELARRWPITYRS